MATFDGIAAHALHHAGLVLPRPGSVLSRHAFLNISQQALAFMAAEGAEQDRKEARSKTKSDMPAKNKRDKALALVKALF